MSVLSAGTAYKKQDGNLAVTKDRTRLEWSPSSSTGASSTLTIDVAKIENLQQTPVDKPKVMLKVIVREPGQAEPAAYTFQFTSKTDARNEANTIRDALSSAMNKASQAAVAAAQTNGGGQSAAMTIAAAISGNKGREWEDDEQLIADVRLQSALLKENSELQKTFLEARNMKPESLSLTQFTKQFWASRVHLLRAHALSQSQRKGTFNVFSEVERSRERGSGQLSLPAEHIKAIMEQYPVMRLVYDEVVPQKIRSDAEFWSRFFQGQLYKTLRGLRIDRRVEAKDAILDVYLDHPLLTGARPTPSELHIPKFIDLEGNEENHSRRAGNRPDMENQQKVLEKGPIIRRLNATSEKLMAAVKPSDADVSAPIGVDESEYEQLRLRDLALQEQQQPTRLNISKQSQLYADSNTGGEDPDAVRIRQLDPAKAIQEACRDLDEHFSAHAKKSAMDLEFEEVDDEEDLDDLSDRPQIAGSLLASKHIDSLINAHRAQYSEAEKTGDAIKSFGGLSEPIYDRLILTHATSLEFLHQFWSAFHSGDPTRVNEVASLVESLSRADDRIKAIADDAEAERDTFITEQEAQSAALFKKTGRRTRVDKSLIKGGREVVNQLLGPIIRGLQVAVETYKRAYEEQVAEMQYLEAD